MFLYKELDPNNIRTETNIIMGFDTPLNMLEIIASVVQ
jgi:hypothetical protein